jgi:1,4-alpha-glucan branching enzyme
MKSHHNQTKTHDSSTPLTPVFFEYTDPAATTVCVAGTFNHWQPSKAMHPTGNGHWAKETDLAPGVYEYCFVVDGHWQPDPSAKESVDNPFGGKNSILRVGDSSEAVHLASAEASPAVGSNKA